MRGSQCQRKSRGNFPRLSLFQIRCLIASLRDSSPSASQAAIAGNPNGEARNASTKSTTAPTACPVTSSTRARSTRITHAAKPTAATTQTRKLTNADRSASTINIGAARIFLTITKTPPALCDYILSACRIKGKDAEEPLKGLFCMPSNCKQSVNNIIRQKRPLKKRP